MFSFLPPSVSQHKLGGPVCFRKDQRGGWINDLFKFPPTFDLKSCTSVYSFSTKQIICNCSLLSKLSVSKFSYLETQELNQFDSILKFPRYPNSVWYSKLRIRHSKSRKGISRDSQTTESNRFGYQDVHNSKGLLFSFI